MRARPCQPPVRGLRAVSAICAAVLFAGFSSAQTMAQAAAGPGGATAKATLATTITFVANAENLTRPRVRYTDGPWTADSGGFLSGAGRGRRLLAEIAPGAGNFRAEFE